VTGTYIEYYDLSEIDASAGSITKLGDETAPVAETLTLPLSDAEAWEGVLVKLESVSVSKEPTSETYNEWEVSDGTNAFMIDDQLYDAQDDFTLTTGTGFTSIVGLMNHTFSNHKIAPRAMSDLTED